MGVSEKTETLSIIIPAYNEEGNIRRTACAIRDVMARENISASIYFVDDGSTDDTWTEIGKATADWDMVRGLRFSRNFGKEAAIFAGLEAAGGGMLCRDGLRPAAPGGDPCPDVQALGGRI